MFCCLSFVYSVHWHRFYLILDCLKSHKTKWSQSIGWSSQVSWKHKKLKFGWCQVGNLFTIFTCKLFVKNLICNMQYLHIGAKGAEFIADALKYNTTKSICAGDVFCAIVFAQFYFSFLLYLFSWICIYFTYRVLWLIQQETMSLRWSKRKSTSSNRNRYNSCIFFYWTIGWYSWPTRVNLLSLLLSLLV